MSKEETTRILQDFHDFLNVSNSLTDVFRYMGWSIVRGLAWITDGLEGITDNVLLIKNFYQNEDIANFVEMLKPFLFILLAFSILYAGYCLILQKKFNREGMIINIFIACCVILLLSTGMDKAGEFTDIAIDTIKTGDIYESEEGSKLSDTVIKQGITDLMMFDKNDWSSKELEEKNTLPTDKVKLINPKERFTEKDTELKLGAVSKEISKSLLTSDGKGFTSTNLDQSGLEFNNEFYYRYSVQWAHILITLSIISFTLLSISIKLARLFFELTFNYVLAIIIALVDVHNGQKTKTVIQSILNIFIVTILIFMSMKIYIIGMGYLDDNLEGITYLIALIAFSIAVIDAPNIIERLFGIDGGLKSGWGMLTGAYIGSKIVGSTVKGVSGMASKGNRNGGHGGSFSNPLRNPSGQGGGGNDSPTVGKYYKSKDEGSSEGTQNNPDNGVDKQGVKSSSNANTQAVSDNTKGSSTNNSKGFTANTDSPNKESASVREMNGKGSISKQGSDISVGNTDNKNSLKSNNIKGKSTDKGKVNSGKTYKTTSLNDKEKKNLRDSNRKGE